MSKLIDDVRAVVEPIIAAHNMETVDLEYKKLYDVMTLIVYIDKEGGVSLDDCEIIHNAIDAPLDELDPTSGAPYNLNVSSPGLDRPFKTARDFAKHIGGDVEVKLYRTVDKLKKFEAVLLAYDGENVDLNVDGATVKLNIKDIAIIRPAIKF